VQGAVPPVGTAKREMSRTSEEREGHCCAFVGGLFLALERSISRAKKNASQDLVMCITQATGKQRDYSQFGSEVPPWCLPAGPLPVNKSCTFVAGNKPGTAG
jgi:hypothetical protein